MSTTMRKAIAGTKEYFSEPSKQLLPFHTTKASLLDVAVRSGEFPEEHYLRCTFSIIVTGDTDHAYGAVVMTLDEGFDELCKDMERIFSMDRTPRYMSIMWHQTDHRVPVRLDLSNDNMRAALRLLQSRGGVDRITVHSGASKD
ncbi:hypothetical protein ACLMJK_004576 [Lecanora helva]